MPHPSAHFCGRTGYHELQLHRFLNPCDPEDAMKILLCILAVLVVAASLFADYKWRKWMAARRRDRQ